MLIKQKGNIFLKIVIYTLEIMLTKHVTFYINHVHVTENWLHSALDQIRSFEIKQRLKNLPVVAMFLAGALMELSRVTAHKAN